MNIPFSELPDLIRKPEKGTQLFMVSEIEELITSILKPKIGEADLHKLAIELFHEMIAPRVDLIYSLDNTITKNGKEVANVTFDFYPSKDQAKRKEDYGKFILKFLRKPENSHWQKYFPEHLFEKIS